MMHGIQPHMNLKALTSPAGSQASDTNWTGLGVVSVRKLRYRTRSKARTVPSRLALSTACPLRKGEGRRWGRQLESALGHVVQCSGHSHAGHHMQPSEPHFLEPSAGRQAGQSHLGRNCTAVTGAWWSAKVTKQKPLDSVHTFTWRQAGRGWAGRQVVEERQLLANVPAQQE